MRCIEIGEYDKETNMQDKININMRCIEICAVQWIECSKI